jgi:hypothetical protein
MGRAEALAEMRAIGAREIAVPGSNVQVWSDELLLPGPNGAVYIAARGGRLLERWWIGADDVVRHEVRRRFDGS